MAERRELTERNRENQQPGQPIDFCQGLPFKVRWMGRDAQTGRDLVQFPDGSIVRAGKRIFSGNCPRGTMVDVVDCGSNGFITIDWRDAEIRQPLDILEPLKGWSIIIDCIKFRFFSGGLNEGYPGDIQKYLQNIKQGQKVLLLPTESLAEMQEIFTGFADKVNNNLFSLNQATIDELEKDILSHDQLWIELPYSFIPDQRVVDLVANTGKSLFLLPLDVATGVADTTAQILTPRLGSAVPRVTGLFLPQSKEDTDDQTTAHPMGFKMVLEKDPIFDGVSFLPADGRFAAQIDVTGTNFKVIGRRSSPAYEYYSSGPVVVGEKNDETAVYPALTTNAIAVLR